MGAAGGVLQPVLRRVICGADAHQAPVAELQAPFLQFLQMSILFETHTGVSMTQMNALLGLPINNKTY